MKKKLLSISFLIVVLVFAFVYLKDSFNNGIVLNYKSIIKPIIIFEENPISIELNSYFYPKQFVNVYYFDEYNLFIDRNYNTNKLGQYNIAIEVTYNNKKTYDSLILNVLEKEVIEVEKIIYIDKIIEVKPNINNNDKANEQIINNDNEINVEHKNETNDDNSYKEEVIEVIEEPYFKGYRDISLAKDSSTSELAKAMSANIDTNVLVTVDLTEVNLSEIGTYSAYYYTEIGDFKINVNIF